MPQKNYSVAVNCRKNLIRKRRTIAIRRHFDLDFLSRLTWRPHEFYLLIPLESCTIFRVFNCEVVWKNCNRIYGAGFLFSQKGNQKLIPCPWIFERCRVCGIQLDIFLNAMTTTNIEKNFDAIALCKQ